MIEHIVKQNERILDILNNYHLTIDDLKKYNTHITDFNNLIGGTKLMIPLLKQEVVQILDKTEVFVKKYYPKITDEIIPDVAEFENVVDQKKSLDEERKSIITNSNNDLNIMIQKENKINENIKGVPYPGIIPPKGPFRKI